MQSGSSSFSESQVACVTPATHHLLSERRGSLVATQLAASSRTFSR